MQACIVVVVLGLLQAQLNQAFNMGMGRKSTVSLRMASEPEPLLLRAARGEKVESVPVWMMRQAGRHMIAYKELCKKHKTFRERSENADVATEISLQPWRRYGTDGCILFSDILTPFPGMGIDFDITEKEGPKMATWTTMADVERIKSMDPHKSTPFVAQGDIPLSLTLHSHLLISLIHKHVLYPSTSPALKNLRHEVGNKATVLGFVGCPYTLGTHHPFLSSLTSSHPLRIAPSQPFFYCSLSLSYHLSILSSQYCPYVVCDLLVARYGTLATYMVEGGSSKEYKEIKSLSYQNPKGNTSTYQRKPYHLTLHYQELTTLSNWSGLLNHNARLSQLNTIFNHNASPYKPSLPPVLHAMLDRLADNIGDYACFQIESGAQVIYTHPFNTHPFNTHALSYTVFIHTPSIIH